MGIPVAREYAWAQDESRKEQEASELGIEFLKDTLKTFRHFTVGDINSAWVSSRYRDWKSSHGVSDDSAQLKSPEEAAEFLESFYSPHSGELWRQEYSDAVAGLLPEERRGNLTAWNPGCGRGCETYSFTALLRKRNPEAHIKVWANDNDLLAISTAPNLILHESEVPPHLKEYTNSGGTGSHFSTELRDRILFEYHDVLHPNPFPEVDCILARDILSFMSPGDQGRLLQEFGEKLKPGGLLIPGANEVVSDPNWEPVEHAGVVAYRNKNR
jgi:chemotaxis methyl-accepting protein methylase